MVPRKAWVSENLAGSLNLESVFDKSPSLVFCMACLNLFLSHETCYLEVSDSDF